MNHVLSPAPQPKAKLWTRDFTIITLGSVISMLGNSMSGFALSLLVLDYTGSNLLYAIYVATFTLPQVVMPIFSGAILDRFSRKKTIYIFHFVPEPNKNTGFLTVLARTPMFLIRMIILGSYQSKS